MDARRVFDAFTTSLRHASLDPGEFEDIDLIRADARSVHFIISGFPMVCRAVPQGVEVDAWALPEEKRKDESLATLLAETIWARHDPPILRLLVTVKCLEEQTECLTDDKFVGAQLEGLYAANRSAGRSAQSQQAPATPRRDTFVEPALLEAPLELLRAYGYQVRNAWKYRGLAEMFPSLAVTTFDLDYDLIRLGGVWATYSWDLHIHQGIARLVVAGQEDGVPLWSAAHATTEPYPTTSDWEPHVDAIASDLRLLRSRLARALFEYEFPIKNDRGIVFVPAASRQQACDALPSIVRIPEECLGDCYALTPSNEDTRAFPAAAPQEALDGDALDGAVVTVLARPSPEY